MHLVSKTSQEVATLWEPILDVNSTVHYLIEFYVLPKIKRKFKINVFLRQQIQ